MDSIKRRIDLGLKIKELRKSKKMTQQQLADLIYKTESSIRKYEKGSVEIPESVLWQIANALNVSKSDLLNLEEVDLSHKYTEIDESFKILKSFTNRLDTDVQIKLLKNIYKNIDYITRLPSIGERADIIVNLCDLLNRYSEMIMNGIELSNNTSFRNDDYLLLLKNYENCIRLIGEHKETLMNLAITLSDNDENLKKFLEKNK